MVMVNFIRDPDVGMYSRVKRLSKAEREAAVAAAEASEEEARADGAAEE